MKIIRIFKYGIFLSYTLIQRKFLCTIYLIQTIDFNWTKSNPSFFNIRKLEFDQVKITYCLVNLLKNIYKPHLLLQLKLLVLNIPYFLKYTFRRRSIEQE